jgi:hypothetical protein
VSSQSFRVPMPRALAACFGLRASEGCSAGVSPQLVAARSSVGFFIPLRSLVSDGAVTAGRWKGNQCALPRKAIHFLARILLIVTDGGVMGRNRSPISGLHTHAELSNTLVFACAIGR